MVSRLKQKTLVACSMTQGKNRLMQFMKGNGCKDGTSLEIPLGFHVLAPGSDADMRVAHTVVLDIRISSRPAEYEARFDVEWKPSSGGLYPSFSGELSIENENYDSFWLVLEGTYEPPFGVIGSAFDAVVGRRIAGQSARELLARIAASMEAGFQADEDAKLASVPEHTAK